MPKRKGLAVERELERLSASTASGRYRRYENLKAELLTGEYLFTLHAFNGGNDHGPEHIKRVLEYLDKILTARTSSFSELELFLLLCSVLLHDQGMLHGRTGHSRVSQRLLKLPEYTAHFEPVELRLVGKVVAVHSSAEKIDDEFRGWEDEEIAAGQSVRPRYLAALLRFADELDEDHRRAKSRLFSKILLPEESILFWITNMAIQSVHPDPQQKVIKVVVEYAADEIDELFVAPGGIRRNALCAVFRKMQKLNSERQYCSQFFEDGLKFSKVDLVFRDYESGNRLQVLLDDEDNGDKWFESNQAILREVGNVDPSPGLPPAPSVSVSTAGSTVVSTARPSESAVPPAAAQCASSSGSSALWSNLSAGERDSILSKNREFIEDALAIVSAPALYGRWDLVVLGQGNDTSVQLTSQLYIGPAPNPTEVQLFPLVKYPVNPPEVVFLGSDPATADKLRAAAVRHLLTPAIWNRTYRSAKANRLTHIIDALLDLRNPISFFIAHAARMLPNKAAWRLDITQAASPVLSGAFGRLADSDLEVRIKPSRRYPLEIPDVIATLCGAPQSWLNGDTINWKRLGGIEGTRLWREQLCLDNPLEAFTSHVCHLLGGAGLKPVKAGTKHD